MARSRLSHGGAVSVQSRRSHGTVAAAHAGSRASVSAPAAAEASGRPESAPSTLLPGAGAGGRVCCLAARQAEASGLRGSAAWSGGQAEASGRVPVHAGCTTLLRTRSRSPGPATAGRPGGKDPTGQRALTAAQESIGEPGTLIRVVGDARLIRVGRSRSRFKFRPPARCRSTRDAGREPARPPGRRAGCGAPRRGGRPAQ